MKPPSRVKEYRCKKTECRCSKRGKLLLVLLDPPNGLVGSGAIVQVACPVKKSRLVRIKL